MSSNLVSDEAASPNRVWYIIECDQGVLTTKSSEFGNHFVYWDNRELAEAVCKCYQREQLHWVSELEVDEMYQLLESFQDAGMKYVVLNRDTETRGNVIPMDEAVDYFIKRLAFTKVLQECFPTTSDRTLYMPQRPQETGRSGCLSVAVLCLCCIAIFVV